MTRYTSRSLNFEQKGHKIFRGMLDYSHYSTLIGTHQDTRKKTQESPRGPRRHNLKLFMTLQTSQAKPP